MLMTMQGRAWLVVALLSPGLALAEPPTPESEVNNLAALDAIVQHCAKLSAKEAPRFERLSKHITEGADAQTLATVRSSPEYQAAFSSTVSNLGQLSGSDAEQACTQFLASNQ